MGTLQAFWAGAPTGWWTLDEPVGAGCWAIVLPPPATTTKLDHNEHKQLHSFMKTAKRAAKEKLVNPTPQVSVTATLVVLTVISVLLVGTLCVIVALRRSRRGHDIEAAGQPTLSQSVYIQIAICRL